MSNQVMTVPPWDIEDPDIAPWEASAYQAGAAVAFGLMGMAEAIRTREPEPDYSFGRCGVCSALRTGESLEGNVSGTGTCRACRYRGMRYPEDRARE